MVTKNYINVKTNLKAGSEWWSVETVAGKGTRLVNVETGMALYDGGGQLSAQQFPALSSFSVHRQGNR
jgi:hypothetical protein